MLFPSLLLAKQKRARKFNQDLKENALKLLRKTSTRSMINILINEACSGVLPMIISNMIF